MRVIKELLRRSTLPLRATFGAWDTNKNGSLDIHELTCALIELCGERGMLNFKPSDVRLVFDAFDSDGNGSIDFVEFERELSRDPATDGSPVPSPRASSAHGSDGKLKRRPRASMSVTDLAKRADRDYGSEHGAIDGAARLAHYLAQGMSYQLIQVLLWELGAVGEKLIPRRAWRDGLRRACMERLALPDPLQQLLTLESFSAPVAPPPHESAFTEFRRAGRGAVVPIPRVEHRAIALRQLYALLRHIERRCAEEGWRGRADERLFPYSVTVYDVVSYVVKPATARHGCSFVEFLSINGEPQASEWFVAHWWGLQLSDMCRCLGQHARDRHLDAKETCYWLAEYSLDQNAFAPPIAGPEPTASPFYRALVASQGAIAIVDGACTSFSRVWFCYEVMVALERAETHGIAVATDGFKFDLYAAGTNSGVPAGVTDGVVATDGQREDNKDEREACIPSAVLRKALGLRFHEGETCVPRDKQHILNLVAERSLDQPPLKFTWQYVQANARARARLLTRLLRPALAQGGRSFEAVLEVLQASRSRSFEASFVHTTPNGPVSGFTADACCELLQHMPVGLTTLSIVVPLVRMPDWRPAERNSLQLLQKLSLARSSWLVTLPHWIGDLPSLKHLFLNECVMLRELPPEDVLRRLTALELLDLSGCAELFHGAMVVPPPPLPPVEEARVSAPAGPRAPSDTPWRAAHPSSALPPMNAQQSIEFLLSVTNDAGHKLLVLDQRGMPWKMDGRLHCVSEGSPLHPTEPQHRFEILRPDTPAASSLNAGEQKSQSLARAKTPLDLRRPQAPMRESRDAATRRLLSFEHDKIQSRIEGLLSELVDDASDNMAAALLEERVRSTIDARWPTRDGKHDRSWAIAPE